MAMFKNYKDICDVVSLIIYCPIDKTFLFVTEPSGEFWIPSMKTEKQCWKTTAHRLYTELFGVEAASNFTPLRIYKIWLPIHQCASVYHAIYKITVKTDVKKKTKPKYSSRSRTLWIGNVEFERQRAHNNLKSPDLSIFLQMATGTRNKDDPMWHDMESHLFVEICEDNIIQSTDVSTDTSVASVANSQLLHGANYTKDDQMRLYCEFLVFCFPAVYMSPQVFAAFIIDMGWRRENFLNLFRSADFSGRGGLTYLELLLWCAATEPGTQHVGLVAEIRCDYIFRYFDNDRKMKLEYLEFKELVAAARALRGLPIDSLNVTRDVDVCLQQFGLLPKSDITPQLFIRAVSESRIRGTSSMLRCSRSIASYLADLHLKERSSILGRTALHVPGDGSLTQHMVGANKERKPSKETEYTFAGFTVFLHRGAQNEMTELMQFGEDSVSASTTKLVMQNNPGTMITTELFGPATLPVEALAAVHYFAASSEHLSSMRIAVTTNSKLVASKAPFTWVAPAEETAMGAMLYKLAEAVRPICQAEPRLLRLTSPVYAIGDLHGNLSALLNMEHNLWPSGAALCPAKIIFLGDFVDRGPHGTELMAYLFAAKLQRPRGVLLIRGNHEIREIQNMFTFHLECLQKYGDAEGAKIWEAINSVFDVLPLAAVVDDKAFCCHGGIPPPWVCPLISAINKIPSPLPRPSEQSTMAWELLWNDPVKMNKVTASQAVELTANEGFAGNTRRGTGHVFDQVALDRFLLANQLTHVIRAHELHQNGFMCQMRGRLVSVFSSSHYCGATNDAGVALLEDNKLRIFRVGYEA